MEINTTEKGDLDSLMSTADAHFNHNLHSFYSAFRGKDKTNTFKPFEVFAQAYHDIYFFITNNPTKPFALINLVNKIFEVEQFHQEEKIVLLMRVLGILSHHPDFENYSICFKQLIDLRHDILPWNEDPEIINEEVLDVIKTYDFESIKQQVSNIEGKENKLNFLKNALFDFNEQLIKMDDFDREYLESTGFEGLVLNEINRLKSLNEFATSTIYNPQGTNGNENPFKSLAQMALFCIYTNKPLNDNNANEAVKTLSNGVWKSGEALMKKLYESKVDRVGFGENNAKKVSDIKAAIDFLESMGINNDAAKMN
ncbi:hypothetical protein [Adhaeribacter aquaticus]|uniref:hypothetical protein n=1 Tax=Adhaeribacter aquaticus TaxID=299567 RepID=UPI000400C55D|nr:hypothetical protein [Adhaeribacter aquaticus]